MTAQLANITFDAADARSLAAFWSAVTGLPVDPPLPGARGYFASLNRARAGGPAYLFIRVAEGKVAKNRVHLDWQAEDRAAEVERLVGLGATVVGDYDQWGSRWTTLRDPEGNEFCVAGLPGSDR